MASERQLMLLLQAALAEGTRAGDAWQEWHGAATLDGVDDDAYQLLPLLYRNLQRLGYGGPEMCRLQGVHRFHWCRNQLLLKHLTGLIQELNAHGIDVLALKGSALLSRYVKDPALRTTAGLDILVPRADAHRAVTLLRRQGWASRHRLPIAEQRFLRSTHAVSLEHTSGTACSLYWAPFPTATWEGAEAPFWRGAMVRGGAGDARGVPAPTEQLVHIGLQGPWCMIRPSVECIIDALFVLRSGLGPIDWNRLAELAARYQGVMRTMATLRYLSVQFAAPIPDAAFEALQNCTISPLERLEMSLARTPTTFRIDHRLRLHWLKHGQTLPGRNTFHRLREFPHYLYRTWQLRGARQ